MRTDVKLGFVIGGILLAVMVVYALVVGRGSSTAPQQTATLTTPAETPIDATGHSATEGAATAGGSSTTGDVASANHNGASTPAGTAAPTGASTPAASTTVPPAASIPDEPLATATPSALQTMTPTVVPEATTPTETAGASKWNWDRLLHEGTPAPMMASGTSSPRAATDSVPVSYSTPSYSSSTGMTDTMRSTSPAATQPVGPGRSHTVKSGETLSSISFSSYGSVKHWSLIAKANPSINPDKLKTGTVLTIPAMTSPENSTPPVAAAVDEKPVDTTKQYKVQPGDTLHKIAMKLYGKTDAWQKIYDSNKVAIGTDPGKLKAGVVLTLPDAPTKTKSVQ